MAGNIYDMEFCHPIIVLSIYFYQSISINTVTKPWALLSFTPFCHGALVIMCATINFVQNLPQGTVIRAVLLLGSEE